MKKADRSTVFVSPVGTAIVTGRDESRLPGEDRARFDRVALETAMHQRG